MKLLVIEDDRPLLDSIRTLLTPYFELDTVVDGEEGLFLAHQGIYDLIVLDVMLPGKDGFTLIKELRHAGVGTPVLMVTARDQVRDRVSGLDLGADDYLVKPFDGDELLARIRALLRRGGALIGDHLLRHRNLVMNSKTKEAIVNGLPLSLSSKQFSLLEYLVQNPERILTKQQIYDRVWGLDSETGPNIVEVYVHHIRKKLRPFGYDGDIVTVRGVGYRMRRR